jgi:hypothetical protein
LSWRVGAALLLPFLGALLGFVAYTRIDHRVPVLVVRNHIEQGAPIGAADLGVARIAPTPGVSALAAGAESQVLGRRASRVLSPGQLLLDTDVGGGPSLLPGQVEIGAAVGESQLPSEGVTAGQKVNVVVTTTSGNADKTAAGVPSGTTLCTATVLKVSRTSTNSSAREDVSLSVPAANLQQVAAAAAAGQISLVPLPPSS